MKKRSEESGHPSGKSSFATHEDLNIGRDHHWRIPYIKNNIFELVTIPRSVAKRQDEILMWLDLCIAAFVADFLIMIWKPRIFISVIILMTAVVLTTLIRFVRFIKKIYVKDFPIHVLNRHALTGWTYRYSCVLITMRTISVLISAIVLFLLTLALHDNENENFFGSICMIIVFLGIIYFLSDCPEHVSFKAICRDLIISVLILYRLLFNDFVYNIVKQVFIVTLSLFDQTKHAGVFLFGQYYNQTFLIRLFCFFSVGSIVSSRFIESGTFIAILRFINKRSSILRNSAMELVCMSANVLISPFQSIFITTLLLENLKSPEINTILASCLVATTFTTDTSVSKILPGRHMVAAHVVTAVVLCAISKLFYPIAKNSIKLTKESITSLETKLKSTNNITVHCVLNLGRFWTYALASTVVASGIIALCRLSIFIVANTFNYSLQMVSLENILSLIFHPLISLMLNFPDKDRETVVHYFSLKNTHSNELAIQKLSRSISSRWTSECWRKLEKFKYLPTYKAEISGNMAYLTENSGSLSNKTSLPYLFPMSPQSESILIYLLSGMNSFTAAGIAIMLITALNYNRRQMATKVLLDAYITAIFTVILLGQLVTLMYNHGGDAVCFIPGASTNLTCQIIGFKIHQQNGMFESNICQAIGGQVGTKRTIYYE